MNTLELIIKNEELQSYLKMWYEDAIRQLNIGNREIIASKNYSVEEGDAKHFYYMQFIWYYMLFNYGKYSKNESECYITEMNIQNYLETLLELSNLK